MSSTEAMNLAIMALGGCATAIGWWIGNTLAGLNEKMERVLGKLEAHEVRLAYLERKQN